MNTMGMADAVTKQYMKENTVFADAFNFLLYNGENQGYIENDYSNDR